MDLETRRALRLAAVLVEARATPGSHHEDGPGEVALALRLVRRMSGERLSPEAAADAAACLRRAAAEGLAA